MNREEYKSLKAFYKKLLEKYNEIKFWRFVEREGRQDFRFLDLFYRLN